MTDEQSKLSPEDRENLRTSLRAWQAEGVKRPLIPMDVDLDGDGIADSWGLDSFGELVVVSGVDLGETVYESDGSGIEATPLKEIDPDGIRGAESWAFRDGQRLTPAMAQDWDGLNNEFHARTGHWLRIRSGIRTDAEHLAIWYVRYTLSPNGRRVYDTRWWNGRLWYRISSAGTVAVPGTSNHQINIPRGQRGALDIYDTGSDAGVLTRGSFRARVFDEIAGKYGFDSEGYNFGETWHKRYNRDPWRAVAGTPANNTPNKRPEEEVMSIPVLLNGQHMFHIWPDGIKHLSNNKKVTGFQNNGPAHVTMQMVSATDSWIPLNSNEFLEQLDNWHIPRSVVDLKTGFVLDVSLDNPDPNGPGGIMVAGGAWSWSRAAYANSITDKPRRRY